MVSITSCISLWYIPKYWNMLSYDNDNKYQGLATTQKYISSIVEYSFCFDD